MHQVSNNKINEMLPDIFNKMPELCAKVGSVKLLDVVRGIIMDHGEKGCLDETLSEWHLTSEDADAIFKMAESFGCDFESGVWM